MIHLRANICTGPRCYAQQESHFQLHIRQTCISQPTRANPPGALSHSPHRTLRAPAGHTCHTTARASSAALPAHTRRTCESFLGEDPPTLRFISLRWHMESCCWVLGVRTSMGLLLCSVVGDYLGHFEVDTAGFLKGLHW